MELLALDKIWGMSPVTAVATLLIVILAIIYYFDVGAPPGPRGLPYIGYWPFLSNERGHIELYDLAKKYGDVYSFTIAGRLLIHLGSMKAVKEAHMTKADAFTQRYEGYSVLNSMFSEGLVCLNGEQWRVQRKFFVQAFKEFGLTSTEKYMDGPVYDSMIAAVESLRAADEKPVDIIPIISLHLSGVLRRMLFNDDGITDEELKGVIENYGKSLTLFTGTRILLHGKFARWFIFPFIDGFKLAISSHKVISTILHNATQRHKETFKEDSVRDVIDAYFKERIDRHRKNDPTADYFTDSSLVSSLVQFVGDGTVGIGIFTSIFFHALLDHPEEQEKLFKELEEVVGPDRQPTLHDKNKLTYVNAFMNEVLRTSDFITMFPGLECTKRTTLNGYSVPEGAITLVNYWACHRDPEVFEDPDDFRPERYVPEPGKQKAEYPLLFGVGKRACAGESFAMLNVFLVLSTLVKNFRIERPKGHKKNPITDTSMEIIAVPRQNLS